MSDAATPYQPNETLALVRAAQGGDATAMRRLFEELYPVIRRHVQFTIRDAALRGDATQEAMLAIHKALPSFRGESKVTTWAITIAARTARRLLRKERNYMPMVNEWEDFQLGGVEPQLFSLQGALAKLTPDKRQAFVLMALFDFTAEETAAALGTFSNTAASRFRHARSELQDILAREAKRADAPTSQQGSSVSA